MSQTGKLPLSTCMGLSTLRSSEISLHNSLTDTVVVKIALHVLGVMQSWSGTVVWWRGGWTRPCCSCLGDNVDANSHFITGIYRTAGSGSFLYCGCTCWVHILITWAFLVRKPLISIHFHWGRWLLRLKPNSQSAGGSETSFRLKTQD